MNQTAALLQHIALTVISIKQTNFVQTCRDGSKNFTLHKIQTLLESYERIGEGVGPFYALEFCTHVPIIVCLDYFGMSHPDTIGIIVWSAGSVAWSCLILIQICLLADDCYEALQGVLPNIRFA
jgi:hypothetical protein